MHNELFTPVFWQKYKHIFVHANSVPAALTTAAFELTVAIVGPKIFNFVFLKV